MESNKELNLPTAALTQNEKVWAGLTYFLGIIGCVLAMVMEDSKKSPYIQLHALQALAFHFIFVAINFLTCGSAAVLYIPVVLWLAFRAYQGEIFDIPVVTPWILKSDHISRVKDLL